LRCHMQAVQPLHYYFQGVFLPSWQTMSSGEGTVPTAYYHLYRLRLDRVLLGWIGYS
jgi:hypothetical protein